MRAQALLTGHGVLGRNPVRYVYQRTNAKGEKIVTGKPELSGYFVGEWLDAPNWYAMKSLMYPDGSRVLGRALSVDGVIRPLPGAVRAQIYMLQGFDFNAEPVVEMQHGLKPGDYVIIKGSDPDKVKRIRLERRKRVTDRGQSIDARGRASRAVARTGGGRVIEAVIVIAFAVLIAAVVLQRRSA
jgi:hypothetical protein